MLYDKSPLFRVRNHHLSAALPNFLLRGDSGNANNVGTVKIGRIKFDCPADFLGE